MHYFYPCHLSSPAFLCPFFNIMAGVQNDFLTSVKFLTSTSEKRSQLNITEFGVMAEVIHLCHQLNNKLRHFMCFKLFFLARLKCIAEGTDAELYGIH